jgi:RNA polymerase sigma factor (sigma-70 family)
VEASTIPATAVLGPQRRVISAGPLLRLRSDEQLVRLFRDGNDEAFRVIHDRYRARLLAYARQMLTGSRLDAEDALQEVFVRAYAALRADDREISLRAWLYRVAHNRCIDELRRPAPPPPETFELMRPPACDPIAETETRESLRRLVADVRRLPEQQRSALLMREMVGLPYRDLAAALDVTVPAVKSLLVRARIGLAQAAEARDTACVQIREELAAAQERGVRTSGLARRHLHDCADCRAYRGELRAAPARFAALVPALGPGALLAKLLGIGGGSAAGGAGASAAGGGAAAGVAGSAAGGGAAAGVAGSAVVGGSAAGGGAAAGVAGSAVVGGGALSAVGVSHVVAVVAVAVVGAGGAVEVQQSLGTHHHHRPAAIVRSVAPSAPAAPATREAPTGAQPDPDAAPGAASAAGELPAATPVLAPAGDPTAAPAPDSGPDTGGATLPPELADDPPATTTPSATPAPAGDAGDGATSSQPPDGSQPANGPPPASGGDAGATEADAASAGSAPGAGAASP